MFVIYTLLVKFSSLGVPAILPRIPIIRLPREPFEIPLRFLH